MNETIEINMEKPMWQQIKEAEQKILEKYGEPFTLPKTDNHHINISEMQTRLIEH